MCINPAKPVTCLCQQPAAYLSEVTDLGNLGKSKTGSIRLNIIPLGGAKLMVLVVITHESVQGWVQQRPFMVSVPKRIVLSGGKQ